MGEPEPRPKREANWPGVLLQIYTTSVVLYGFIFLRQCSYTTIAFGVFLSVCGALGITAGAHRLWAHRSYKAGGILRLMLMIFHTLNMAGSIYDWVLDHRIHHKYLGTEKDPYNHKRGFFFAHIGHTMQIKPYDRAELAKEIDMSDIEADSIVMFQKKYYWFLVAIIALLLPINAPVEYWGETMLNSVMVIGLQRLALALHFSYLVNSAQIIWRLQPGDRFFSDSNWVYAITKSHWHDYHYMVPWDFQTNEFGSYNTGVTSVFIKICAALGLAYNLRTIDSQGIRDAIEKFTVTKKPLVECLNEVEDDVRDRLPEDCYLLDRSSWPAK